VLNLFCFKGLGLLAAYGGSLELALINTLPEVDWRAPESSNPTLLWGVVQYNKYSETTLVALEKYRPTFVARQHTCLTIYRPIVILSKDDEKSKDSGMCIPHRPLVGPLACASFGESEGQSPLALQSRKGIVGDWRHPPRNLHALWKKMKFFINWVAHGKGYNACLLPWGCDFLEGVR